MITYILETLAFQLVFLLAYDLFLKKETFFQWNRLYLLATFGLSLVLPWIKVEALKSQMPEQLGTATVYLTQLDGLVLRPEGTEASFWSIMPWYFWVMAIGAAVAAFWFGQKLFQLAQLRRQGIVDQFPEFTKVTIKESALAFSFFRNIFLGAEIRKDKEANIIAHELVHVRQHHSLDLLIFELARIVFWFNPLVYVYQNRMAELHEFIADAKAVKHNKKEHFEILLSEAFSTQRISFVNQFFTKSLIKKRIVMLQKKRSKAVWQLKYVLLLPLVLGMLVYTSCETGKEDNPVEEESGVALKATKEVPFAVVDEVPIFPGCEDAQDKVACFQEKMQEHIRKNFHYPEAAQEQGIQGRVNSVFRISPEGNVVDIVMKGPDQLLEEETKRILSKLPTMEPGRHEGEVVQVPFSIPITFRLEGSEEKTSTEENTSDSYPFATIDEVPIFPGCENAVDKKACFDEKLKEHIRKNFRYPEAAQEQGIQGRVAVLFTIDADGNISAIKKRGPHELLENEAVRIIERLPKMQPGKQGGKAMNVPYMIPITFRLQSQPKGTTGDGSEDYLLISGSKIKKQGKLFFEGTVMDKESMELSGVVISVEGKDSGVMSNFNGGFSIEVEEGDVLKFQYSGLSNKLVAVSNY